MLSKNSDVSCFIAWRRLSSKSGNASRSGAELFRFRRCSHCSAKLATSASERGSAEHSLHLLLEHARVSSACPGSPASAADRPERCSRGRTTAATPARRRPADTRCRARRSAGRFSNRIRNSGLARMNCSADSMPRSNASLPPAVGPSDRTRSACRRSACRRDGGRRRAPATTGSSSHRLLRSPALPACR